MAKRERDPEAVKIGQRVRMARQNKGLTMEKVAEGAETSIQFLSQVEKGEQTMTMVKFARLAKVLGVSTDYLLYGEDRIGDRAALAVEYLAGMNPIERDLTSRMVIAVQGLLDEIAPEP